MSENEVIRYRYDELLRDYQLARASRAEVLRELGETNEALAACQSQASGEITHLRAEIDHLREVRDLAIIQADKDRMEIDGLRELIDARDKAAGFVEVPSLSPEAQASFRAAVREVDGINLREVRKLRELLRAHADWIATDEGVLWYDLVGLAKQPGMYNRKFSDMVIDTDAALSPAVQPTAALCKFCGSNPADGCPRASGECLADNQSLSD